MTARYLAATRYSVATRKARSRIQHQIEMNIDAGEREPERASEFYAIALGQAIALATLCAEHDQWDDLDAAKRQQQRLFQLMRRQAA